MLLEFRSVLFRSRAIVCTLVTSRRRHTRFLNVTGVQTCALPIDRKSTRLNSSHIQKSRMPSSACDWSSDLFFSDLSEEHTSELQSHSEILYAVFCLKKKNISSWAVGSGTCSLRSHSHCCISSISSDCEVLMRPARSLNSCRFFCFNDTATTEIYTNLNTLSLHDARPISRGRREIRIRIVKGGYSSNLTHYIGRA